MNKEIAFILKEKLANQALPFISKYYGLVEVVLEPVEGEMQTTIIKRLPVATEMTYINENDDVTCYSKEQIAQPESSQRGILYFEDNGTTITESNRVVTYLSRLDLVCWINVARIKQNFYERIESSAIAMILEVLKNNNKYENVGDIQRMKITPTQIKPKNSNIFAKYTYDEAHSQYVRPPFTYFSISLEVTFTMNPKCFDNFDIIDGEICY